MGRLRALHHVRLAIPAGGEPAARAFWTDVMGLQEIRRPEALLARGGCWFRSGRVEVHLDVQQPFEPAEHARPGFVVDDLDAAVAALREAGLAVGRDDTLPGFDRLSTEDPFGNLVELLAHRPADVIIRWAEPADEADVRAAVAELAEDGFDFVLDLDEDDDFAAWCERVRGHARGEHLREGWVPATGLVAELDGHVVGRLHVRHELTPYLRDVGGHIGYGVRPAWRGRGVAGVMLRHGLDLLRELGVDEALVTCDDDNRASAAVIERAGGRLVGVTIDEGSDLHKRRYVVTTTG